MNVKNCLLPSFFFKKKNGIALPFCCEKWLKYLSRCNTLNQRFLPSEFTLDVDHHHAVEPAASAFEQKAKIRRAIETQGIPYTYIQSNAFAGHFLPNLGQLNDATAPPRDKLIILGDGNVKGN